MDNMNKKNGFTLIELLAVILILGIIALIAIPTVNKIVDNAKKGAFESTIKNIEKKVGDTCSIENLKGKNITNAYTITDGKILPEVDIKGMLPDGTINVDNDCKITYSLSNKTYIATKSGTDSDVIITKTGSTETKKNGPLYVENDLNGADPVLDSGMIPVTIANDGTVKKADLYSEWYNYSESKKNWANVVIFKNEAKRTTYKNAEAGTNINLNDITAYLVWIPRYSYAIPTVTDTNNPPSINIKFENKNTNKSNGTAIGTSYYTHPAFTFGSEELNGIWVGKFEATGTSDAPTILPNIASLTNQSISEQFATSRLFNTGYGITNDSHMMKNSEWGAVAYLSHSIHGINKEIRINNYWNNYENLTGCGASSDNASISTTCGIIYGNNTSYPQSTTGNISGIFDMSGGGYEKVMAVYKNQIAESGFTSLPSDQKYYDLYTGPNDVITYESACNGGPCKGHANYETKNWYNDVYCVVDSYASWVGRGGHHSMQEEGGAFTTNGFVGDANQTASFRFVLTK